MKEEGGEKEKSWRRESRAVDGEKREGEEKEKKRSRKEPRAVDGERKGKQESVRRVREYRGRSMESRALSRV